MNNIAEPNYVNMWEGMSLDQINGFKDRMQKQMPIVELMRIKARPHSLMGRERDVRLRIMRYGEKEIEEMTGYKSRIKPAHEPDTDFDEVLKSLSATRISRTN